MGEKRLLSVLSFSLVVFAIFQFALLSGARLRHPDFTCHCEIRELLRAMEFRASSKQQLDTPGHPLL